MRRAEDPEEARAEGVAIARDIARQLRRVVQGVQVSPPSGNIEAALAVIDGLR